MSPVIFVIGVVGMYCSTAPDELPVVRLERAPLVVERSCRVQIAPGAVFHGAGDAGVIRIMADGVVVEFAEGSVLRGAAPDVEQDKLVGTGIVVEGHSGVTLRAVNVSGFKVGVRADRADGLVIDGGRFEGLYAQRLKSTPDAEDAGDWLWPHRNDQDEWTKTYGAAVSIKQSSGVCIHDVRVRRGQNGILLSRVNESRVFDCDCSFLSGWGLGMWRSSKNVVSRNLFDFCIRGYSHGVYNRGQDSAGILMFEQCCENVIVQNSATHGGDGFFGFAGREALGEEWAEKHKGEPVPDEVVARHKGLGCTWNVLLENDFSYAAAHGIEMTFSFGNRFIGNRLVENGICGVWGGYSAGTLISGNTFVRNGSSGGGGEGGGINIEHGRENRIEGNTFTGDSVGIRLWARPGSSLEKLPWGVANGELVDGVMRVPSARTRIAMNSFANVAKELWVHNSQNVSFANNQEGGGVRDIDPLAFGEAGLMELAAWVRPAPLGARRAIGARMELEGRDQIVMGEWGPWDHESVMVRAGKRESGADVYEVFGVDEAVRAEVIAGEVRATAELSAGARMCRIRVDPGNGAASGVWPYRVRIRGQGLDREVSGTIVQAAWDVRVWAWDHDPLKDAAAWRAEASGEKVIQARVGAIDWALGYKGPGCISPEVAAANIGGKKYGVIASTKVRLAPGKWVVKTLSDDGVRITADGKTIIERWNIHGPTADSAVVEVAEERDVAIGVEYFQNDGFAVLRMGIEKGE